MKSLAFGEILWDVFADHQTLGGAPLNVAGHLARLGADSCIVSAVGADRRGDEALSLVRALGVGADYVSALPGLPTGTATIFLDKGIPSYEFNDPCAWDAIDLSEEQLKAIQSAEWDVVCFGTLAQRSPASRACLRRILESVSAKTVFFDVNLRKNYYSREILEDGLKFADILKVNDEEVAILAALLDIPLSADTEESFADAMIGRYGLRIVLVTLGKAGALARYAGETVRSVPAKVAVVDTVGAGDSFSAGFLAALGRGCPVSRALSFGAELADFVVTRKGAIPEYDEALLRKIAELGA